MGSEEDCSGMLAITGTGLKFDAGLNAAFLEPRPFPTGFTNAVVASGWSEPSKVILFNPSTASRYTSN